MPHFVVHRIQNALNDHSKSLKGSHVHILGVAYKRDIDDVRESPALDIIHLLLQRGVKVTFSDPYVAKAHIEGHGDIEVSDTAKSVAAADCVVCVTDHKKFDYAKVLKSAKLIVDTRNAFKKFKSDKIVLL
jgi:UDP-N-acetyl-D-glucosamine dehydrogenase